MTYLYEIPAHFIHELKTKGYDLISVNVFHRKLMRFQRKKGVNSVPNLLLAAAPGNEVDRWSIANAALFPIKYTIV